MSDPARTARRYVVSGRVQGVGFRYFVRQQAQALNLAGWVRNLPDGRVEAFIEGPRTALDSVEQRLRRGPTASNVKSVDTSDASPSLATEFEIRR